MKRFIFSIVREVSIVWTDARMDALMRRDHEIFKSRGEASNQDSKEIQEQIEQISCVIDGMIEKIELINQRLSVGKENPSVDDAN
jgi:hypothetical protein